MMRRLLVLHAGGGQIRGSEEALLTVLAGLDRTLIEPIVVHTNRVLTDPLRALDVTSIVSPLPELLIQQGAPARLPIVAYLRTLVRLFRECRRRRIALIYANGGLPCQLGVPLAVLLRRKLVCYLHHPAPKDHHYCWLTMFADQLLFPSRFTAADTRAVIGKTGDVVPVGIDVDRYSPVAVRDEQMRADLGIASDEIVIAQVGALVPHKGHRVLIHAFDTLRSTGAPARLLIIGAGQERDALEADVAARGLTERVKFTGYVDDVLPYLQHVIDINVLASTEEGLGLVNLQASACALPNVGTDDTGIRETIDHGRTGFLFPPGDASALADNLLRLCGDAGLRHAQGAQGRELVIERFASASYATRMQQILLQAMDRR